MIKTILIANSPIEDPIRSIYTFILEEEDTKRIIEEAESKYTYARLEPIELKYINEYGGEIEDSPRLEIRHIDDYGKFSQSVYATPIVLENNTIKLDIYLPRSIYSVSLARPSILAKISIEDLKNKVLRTSVNSLKFDFGDGVFGEVYLKVPIDPKEPDPIKIVSSNLSYYPIPTRDETTSFKHTCTPVYSDGWVIFPFEYSTPGKSIKFLSNLIDISFINSEDRSYIDEVIKIAQKLLETNYGITTKLLKEGNGGFLLDIVELNYKFEVGSVFLICSDISKVASKYLSFSYGDINLGVSTRYIYKMGKGKFLIEFIHKVR
jgi:hypothetical protein